MTAILIYQTILLLWFHAKKEAGRIRDGAHWDIVALRIIVLVSISLIYNELTSIFSSFLPGNFVIYLSIQIAIFALKFDVYFNHHRGREALYLGDQAWLDRFFQDKKLLKELVYVTPLILLIWLVK